MKSCMNNMIKRLALAAFSFVAIAPMSSAQEALHLFYKNGNIVKHEITENTKVLFDKRPYILETGYSYDSADTIYLGASAGRTYNLGRYESNVECTIKANADWVIIRTVPDSLKNQYGLTEKENLLIVYATANSSDKAREATLTIKEVGGKTNRKFTVYQAPYTLSLFEDEFFNNGRYNGNACTYEDSLLYAWNDTIGSLSVYPNHNVKLVSYPEWMTLKYFVSKPATAEEMKSNPYLQDAAGSQFSYASFTFQPNTSEHDRVGVIEFEGLYGQKIEARVTQKGLNEYAIHESTTSLVKQLADFGKVFPERQTDYGFPSLMLSTDSRGIDMVARGDVYNWYKGCLGYTDLVDNTIYTAQYWSTLYYHIMKLNQAEKDASLSDELDCLKYYKAQICALRAFDYFYLAQMYSHTYKGNENALCVPIVTAVSSYELYATGCPRATVAEVYSYIMKNLDMAIQLLKDVSVKPADKCAISKEAAYGLRARVNLVMNNWEAAYDDAQRVINSGVAAPYTRDEVAKPSFNDINASSWLWGFDMCETDRAVTTSICNFPSFMGSFSYGYAQVGAWRMVSKSLYNSIPSTDVRKGWFLDGNAASDNLTAEQKNYLSVYGTPAYTQVKFAPYNDELGTSLNASDIPLMRIEEMYLISAEAQGMMGKVAEGAAVLENFVRNFRDASYSCPATNSEELREAVWMQRRIELWGEGHSYYDLMRLNKGVDRRGAGFESQYVFNIPAGDPALIYPIPAREMNNNVMLIQNEGHPVTPPTPVAE